MTERVSFDVLDSVSQKPPISAPRRAAPIVGAVIGVLISAGWYAAMRMDASAALAREDARAIEQASKQLGARVAEMQRRLRAEARLLAEDTRVKAMLATQGMDEATIVDILQDLRRVLEPDMIAVLSSDGRVLAVIGDRSLNGLDLGDSALIRSAGSAEGGAIDVWGIGTKVMPVAASSVEVGGRTVAYLALGLEVGAQVLQEIAQLSGAEGALIVADKLVSTPPGLERAFEAQLGRVQPGTTALVEHGGELYLARLEALAERALPGSVLWLRPARRADDGARRTGLLATFPILWTAILSALLAWQFARREL